MLPLEAVVFYYIFIYVKSNSTHALCPVQTQLFLVKLHMSSWRLCGFLRGETFSFTSSAHLAQPADIWARNLLLTRLCFEFSGSCLLAYLFLIASDCVMWANLPISTDPNTVEARCYSAGRGQPIGHMHGINDHPPHPWHCFTPCQDRRPMYENW